jgi:glucan phosphoethanolaminetransferase (alkaline phosphatase superfamily)
MGAHSVDQVLFGSLIGLWLGLTLEFIVRKWMMGHIMNLNKDRSRTYLPLGILAFLVSVGVFILLAVAIYLFLYCEKYIKTIPAG